jgi:hypothetical protein
MLLSFALYCGLVMLLFAPLFGVHVFAAPFLICAALLWPPHDERAVNSVTNLDRVMQEWQFRERHVTRVAAPPERVYESIFPVTAHDILLFRTLTSIRRLGRPAPASIMNAPENEPLLHLATRTSFRYVAIDPPKEIVVESVIIRPRDAIAAMNFLVTPDGRGGSFLSTETRVATVSPSVRRNFAVYWRIIRPGSGIIRVMWLRAIRKRAES